MPLYMDRHDLVNATPEQFAEVHTCDLDIQDRFGVRFITYWYHAGAVTSFCLVEAPSADLAQAVHAASHGNVANQIIEVDWQSVESLLGGIREPRPGDAWEDIAVRTVLCADVAPPPGRPAPRLARRSRKAVSREAQARGGLAVVRDRGVIGGFISVAAALETALALQQSLAPLSSIFEGSPMRLSIGVSLGEPVDGTWGLFGRAIDVASHLCDLAPPGVTLVTGEVCRRAPPGEFSFTQAGTAFLPAADSVVLYRLERRLEGGEGHAGGGFDRELKAPPSGLSRRELEVLQLIARGKTNKEIARGLYISETTVATHVRNILQKTDVANRAEAASFAYRHHLL
jgi:DNA-binding CsgD family transcriptional regulator